MSDRSNQLLLLLTQAESQIDQALRQGMTVEWVSQADDLELTTILTALEHIDDWQQQPRRRLLEQIVNQISLRLRENAETPHDFSERVANLYRKLEADNSIRHMMLAWLTNIATVEALELFADLIAEDPPGRTSAAAVGFVPLLQQFDYNSDALFPRLLDGLQHLSVAVLILDLSNFLYRTGRIDHHPAQGKNQMLLELFGGIVNRLSNLEEKKQGTKPEEFVQLRTQVSEGVALAVALCDSLAFLQEKGAIPQLQQAVKLSHRQLRCEAAAALARLGEEKGKQRLIELAQYPVTRLKVLAFAEELGCLAEVDPLYQSEEAKNESELALWLSQGNSVWHATPRNSNSGFAGALLARAMMIHKNALYLIMLTTCRKEFFVRWVL